MAEPVEVKVPDIGDFSDVPVIEVMVGPGDEVQPEDPLVTLESDKAAMDVPAPEAGTVRELRVAVGDKVSEGTVILLLEAVGAEAPEPEPEQEPAAPEPEREHVSEDATTAPTDHAPSGGSDGGGDETIEVRVPDIGDFTDVPVIELLVAPGEKVEPEDGLVTLESDKASMDVPSPVAGTVKELRLAVGDKVSEGAIILLLESAPAGDAATATGDGAGPDEEQPEATEPSPAAGPPPATFEGEADVHAQVVVLGSGVGGYTAAFRAADLGLKTMLVERDEMLGGVCLNVGCIPSKALLHAARVIAEAEEFGGRGIRFARPELDLDELRGWKDGIVERLTGGLSGLAKQRKVDVVRGTGRFVSANVLEVDGADGTTTIGFDHAVIAAGSEAVRLPFLPDDDPRVIDSTGALDLADVPERLLVIGGGIIGLEMATVYDALGAGVTVVELLDSLLPGVDKDLVRPLQRRIEPRYDAIHVKTKVAAVDAQDDGLHVTFEGEDAPEPAVFDRVLVAVGRRPNGGRIAAENAGVVVDEHGFIPVDEQMRTSQSHIFAIGDVAREPMLAHKAAHEGKVAAEVIAGEPVSFEGRVIPSVAYTDPEVAWMGLTEAEAKERGIEYEKGSFPWAASGRALALGGEGGMTKLLFEPGTGRLLGAGMVGPQAGDLVAEAVLARELGADAEDIGLAIHPHPTLSETVAFAAEMVDGTITDLMPPRKQRAAAKG